MASSPIIADFVARQNTYNDQLETELTNLEGDFDGLAALILKLQTAPGPISAEDQASLNQLETRSAAFKARLAALAAKTPPVAPEIPGETA